MKTRAPHTADLFAVRTPPPAPRRAAEGGPWKGPGTEPHDYHPDVAAMGDCSVCGHTYRAHLPDEDDTAPAPPYR